MIKLAKIHQINKNDVVLKLEQNIQCSDCKSRCSDGFLSFLFHKKNQGLLFVALNNRKVNECHLLDDRHFFDKNKKLNDVIGLKFDDTQVLKIALLLYGLPIVLIVLFLIVGYFSFSFININTDLGGLIGLLLGLLSAKYFINVFNKTYKPKVKYFS